MLKTKKITAIYEAARALVAHPMDQDARANLEFLVNYKECATCKETKHVDDFVKNATTGDGYRGSCKACRREQNNG